MKDESVFIERCIFGPETTQERTIGRYLSSLGPWDYAGEPIYFDAYVVETETVSNESLLLRCARGFIRGLVA